MAVDPAVQGSVAELARENRSSVELSRDSKGDYRWSIKLYFDADQDDEAEVIKQLARLDGRLRSTFLPS
jgi:hypothetical protein